MIEELKTKLLTTLSPFRPTSRPAGRQPTGLAALGDKPAAGADRRNASRMTSGEIRSKIKTFMKRFSEELKRRGEFVDEEGETDDGGDDDDDVIEKQRDVIQRFTHDGEYSPLCVH